MKRTKQQQRMIDLRKITGMTQEAFAAFIGCTQANIGHYENRDQVPSVQAAKRIMMQFRTIGIMIRYEHIYGLPDEE